MDRLRAVHRRWWRFVVRKLIQRTWHANGKILQSIKDFWRRATTVPCRLPLAPIVANILGIQAVALNISGTQARGVRQGRPRAIPTANPQDTVDEEFHDCSEFPSSSSSGR